MCCSSALSRCRLRQVFELIVDYRLAQENLTPSDAADEANFIRRVTLDLAGRIPTSAEVQAYLLSSDADKKSQLIERLLVTPDFAYHQRNEFDLLLMAGVNVRGGAADWKEWLLKAQQEGRAWPQIFRELMLASACWAR